MANIAQQDDLVLVVNHPIVDPAFTSDERAWLRKKVLRGTILDVKIKSVVSQGVLEMKVLGIEKFPRTTNVVMPTTPPSIDLGAFQPSDYTDDIPSDE